MTKGLTIAPGKPAAGISQPQIDARRGKAIAAGSLLIDGQLIAAADGGTLPVFEPGTGRQLSTVADATSADVDRAVTSARRAYNGGWRTTSPDRRRAILLAVADAIEAQAVDLAVLGVRDNGTEIAMAHGAEPISAARTFRYYAEAIDKLYGSVAPTEFNRLGMILREPVGVAGVIVPFNFPLMIGAWKIAAALAAGNCVVLKPAETASLTLLRLGELALYAGLPPGVLNVVTGEGRIAGDALAHHCDVDVLAFTGSGAVGRHLMHASAKSNLKRVFLELGGKSPNIVFADCPDLEAAAKAAARAVYRNSGQVCIAGTRILVEQSVRAEFCAAFARAATAIIVGDPLSLATQAGAINSQAQLNRIVRAVDQARAEGHVVEFGGEALCMGGGWFYPPTALVTPPDAAIAREEIFGPVAVIHGFADEDEALRIANSSDFGLAAGVWTRDLGRAHRMAQQVRAGVIHVNCYGGADQTMPLGGVGQSGNGYDKSLHALDKFTQLKSVWMAL